VLEDISNLHCNSREGRSVAKIPLQRGGNPVGTYVPTGQMSSYWIPYQVRDDNLFFMHCEIFRSVINESSIFQVDRLRKRQSVQYNLSTV
jgi:hypothetical protein